MAMIFSSSGMPNPKQIKNHYRSNKNTIFPPTTKSTTMILDTWKPSDTTHNLLMLKSLKKEFSNAFKPKSKQIRLTSMQLSFLHWKGPFRPVNCCLRVEIYLCLLNLPYAKDFGLCPKWEAN